MTVLDIVHFPDPRLRKPARDIHEIDNSLQRFIDDMFETMYDAPGVGLAANQVGDPRNVAVMDCSENRNEPIVMINPEIISLAEEIEVEEGCLSVPGHYDKVNRFRKARVRAMDRDGRGYELEGEDLLAQCIQHEVAHLQGKLYIDLLSRLKQQRIRKKLEKEQKQMLKQAQDG